MTGPPWRDFPGRRVVGADQVWARGATLLEHIVIVDLGNKDVAISRAKSVWARDNQDK